MTHLNSQSHSQHANTKNSDAIDTEIEKSIRPNRTIQASSNLYQTAHGWRVLVALPQVDPNSIELETRGHQLHLKAYTQNQTTQYIRQITFPAHVRWGEMNATWHHGILRIDLVRADIQTQKIEVQVAG